MELKWLSNNKAKEIKSLHIKKYREESGLFIAEGRKCVADLLGAFHLEFIISSERWFKENKEFFKWPEKVLLVKDKSELKRISALTSPPEVIAVFRIPLPDISEKKLNRDKTYLFLDDIQDPGNLGTIIRTCDWFGVYEIYASEGTVDVFNPKVVQSTMGSLCRVKVNYMNLEDMISRNPGLRIYGTLLTGTPIKDCNPKEKGVIIMGNEGKGISDNLKQLITIPVTIPPVNKENHPDSLNVAIATAIFLSYFQQ